MEVNFSRIYYKRCRVSHNLEPDLLLISEFTLQSLIRLPLGLYHV